MRNVIQSALLILVLAANSFSQGQRHPEIARADPKLVPQAFSVDDVRISVQVPFQLLVNG